MCRIGLLTVIISVIYVPEGMWLTDITVQDIQVHVCDKVNKHVLNGKWHVVKTYIQIFISFPHLIGGYTGYTT